MGALILQERAATYMNICTARLLVLTPINRVWFQGNVIRWQRTFHEMFLLCHVDDINICDCFQTVQLRWLNCLIITLSFKKRKKGIPIYYAVILCHTENNLFSDLWNNFSYTHWRVIDSRYLIPTSTTWILSSIVCLKLSKVMWKL